jgi:acetylornithine deacetylase/succinyl-diaminopimelate desuccinylase-like protein
MSRRSLRPQLNQIRGWVRQGRTDAWIAHQLDVTVQQIQAFKREQELEADGAEPGGAAFEEVDLRAEDDAALRAGVERVRAALEAVGEGLRTTVESLGRRPAGAIDPRHPLLQAARRARERAGLPPAREDAASTDANAAYGRGIPAITVGVTTGGNAHRPDEYIDLAPIRGGLAALTALAEEVGGLTGDARERPAS